MSAIPKPTKNVKNQTSKTMETMTETKTRKPYIKFDEYDPSKYTFKEKKQEEIKGTPHKLWRLNTVYDYEDGSAPREFKFEGPELTSRYGISQMTSAEGKVSYSIGCVLSRKDEVESQLIEFLGNFRSQNYKIVDSMKKDVGARDLGDNTFKKMFHFKKDVEDEATADPTWYINLFWAGSYKSLFTDLEEKPIDWKLLENATVKFIPVIVVKGITVLGGGKNVGIKMQMESAIVTSIEPLGTRSSQGDTIKKLLESRPDLAAQVASQLNNMAQLKLTQPQAGAASAGSTKVEEKAADAPSNSGITKRTALPAAQDADDNLE